MHGYEDDLPESIKRGVEDAMRWVQEHADCEHDWKRVNQVGDDHELFQCQTCGLKKFEKLPGAP